ncbi:hypothetical protein V9T40_004478 [Parthenolecanium corni]|uniref:Uncharacterized protein n=1 Tax=Parthenolecanium corni TaxID=536013 RepID=A0AAN9YB20_9HEMI
MMSLAAWSSSLVLPEFDSYGSTSSDVRARLVTATSRNLSFFLDLVQKVVDNCSKMAGCGETLNQVVLNRHNEGKVTSKCLDADSE